MGGVGIDPAEKVSQEGLGKGEAPLRNRMGQAVHIRHSGRRGTYLCARLACLEDCHILDSEA